MIKYLNPFALSMSKGANTKFLFFLFLFALSIRLLVFSFYLSKNENYWQVDSNAYHSIAVQISEGKGITKSDGEPNFHRLPLYSIFLAINYIIFGPNKKIALISQIIIASFIPILIFILSLNVFPLNLVLAKLAGIIASMHAGFVLYSGFFMTETLFIFLFLIFCIIFFKNLNVLNYSKKWIFIAGVFLGLASLTRPVGQFLIFASILITLLSKEEIKNKILKSTYLFFGWFITVLPWLFRNYLLLGNVFFHTLPGGHFLNLSAARVVMQAQNISYAKAREILAEELAQKIKEQESIKKSKLSPIEVCYVSEKLAMKYFTSNPILSLKCWTLDIFRTTFSLYSAEILYIESGRKEIDYFDVHRTIWSMIKRYLLPQTNLIWLKILIYFEILFFAFLQIGFISQSLKEIFFRLRREVTEEWEAYRNLLIFISVFLIISLAGGYARMRLPAEPFFIIISLLFWTSLFKPNVYNNK